MHQPVRVLLAVMTDSLNVIPLITQLFTKHINNMTQNINLNITLLIKMILFLPLKQTVGLILQLELLA